MKILYAILFAFSAFGQTAQFPGALATDQNLKVAVNGVTTLLTADITTGQTTLPITSCAGIVPYTLVTIDQEIMDVTGCSGTVLIVDQRGFDGTPAATHAQASPINAYVDAWHHNSLSAEVQAIESALGVNLSHVTGGSGSSPLFLTSTYNSTSSNTGGLQEAVNAAQTAGGGQVIVTGDITFTGTSTTVLVSGSGISINGASGNYPVIRYGATGATAINVTGDYVQVRNLKFLGDLANVNVPSPVAPYAIQSTNNSNIVFQYLNFEYAGSGMLLTGVTNAWISEIVFDTLQFQSGIGIGINGGESQYISHLIADSQFPGGFFQEAQACVLVAASGGVFISDSNVAHTGTGVTIAPQSGKLVEFSTITNFLADQMGNAGFLISPSGTGLVHGLDMLNDWGSSSGSGLFTNGSGTIDGLYIQGGKYYNNYLSGATFTNGTHIGVLGAKFTRNTQQESGTVTTNGTLVSWQSGSQFNTVMASRPIVINGVTYTVSFINSSSVLTLTTSAGVQGAVSYSFGTTPSCGLTVGADLTHVSVAEVISGVTDDLGGGGTQNTQSYGICVNPGTGDYIRLSDNDLSNNISGGINFNASGTHNRVVDNLGYNPRGQFSISVGASPFIYTAGPTPETVYVVGGTVSNVTSGTISFASSTGQVIPVSPYGTVTVTYSVAPLMAKDIQ